MYDCIVEESVRSCVAQGGVGCHMDVVVVAVAHLEHVNMTCDTFYLSHAITFYMSKSNHDLTRSNCLSATRGL